MASLSDIILQQVKGAAGNVEIPANIKDKVFSGISESVIGSLTQTAAKAGGIDQITQLLTGKANAATSPITALAGNLFKNNVAGKLGLGAPATNALTALLPGVIGKLSGFIKDQDGDGDIDLQDILFALKGGGQAQKSASVLGMAAGLLGGFLKK